MPTVYDSETTRLAKASAADARLPIDDNQAGAKYVKGSDVINVARYLGRYASDTAATAAVAALEVGDLYLNTADNEFKVYVSSDAGFETVSIASSGGGGDDSGGLTTSDIEDLVQSITLSGETLTITKQDGSESSLTLPGESVYRVFSSLKVRDLPLTTENVTANNAASTQNMSFADSTSDTAELGLALDASDHIFKFTNISTAEDRILHISGFVPISHNGGGGAVQVDFNEYLSTAPNVVNRTTRLFLEGLADADRVCEFKLALNQTIVKVRKDRLYRIVVTFTKTGSANAVWGIDYPANSGDVAVSFSPAAEIEDELPAGGAAGDVLTKSTAADGDVEWSTPAASATIAAPPDDGVDHYYGQGEDDDGDPVGEWKPVEDLLSRLTVETLPDANDLVLSSIRFLLGAPEPGRHTVVMNPETPLNSLILTAGTDSSNSDEHGSSLYTSSGGTYGGFLRNHDEAVANFSWFTGSNPSLSLSIKDKYVNSDGSIAASVTVRGSRASTFTYTLTRDAQGDFMEGSVQYRHYSIASAAEGGPGITASDFSGISDGDQLGLELFTDTAMTAPINIEPAHVWFWNDRPVDGGRIVTDVFTSDPSIVGWKPGSLIVSDDKLKFADPEHAVTPDNQNLVVLNTAGHDYGLPGSTFAQSHTARGSIVDDPREFVGQMDWTAGEGSAGEFEIFLKDNDMDERLDGTLYLRTQLWGRSAIELYTLTKSADSEGQYINGVFYARYSVTTTYYEDDRLFNGVTETRLLFYTAWTSEASHTILAAVRGSNVIVSENWKVAGFEFGPNIVPVTLDTLGTEDVGGWHTNRDGVSLEGFRMVAFELQLASNTAEAIALAYLPSVIPTNRDNAITVATLGGSTGLFDFTQTEFRYRTFSRIVHTIRGVY